MKEWLTIAVEDEETWLSLAREALSPRPVENEGPLTGGDLKARPVGRTQILAFRAAAHSLDRRCAPTELHDVVGACGIQDTPPGNADVSLAARLDLDGPMVKEAVGEQGTRARLSRSGAHPISSRPRTSPVHPQRPPRSNG